MIILASFQPRVKQFLIGKKSPQALGNPFTGESVGGAFLCSFTYIGLKSGKCAGVKRGNS
jgi:hypothetical protein